MSNESFIKYIVEDARINEKVARLIVKNRSDVLGVITIAEKHNRFLPTALVYML